MADGSRVDDYAASLFCCCLPSANCRLSFSQRGDIADETQKDDGKDGGKGMGLSLFGSWITNFFETSNEVRQG